MSDERCKPCGHWLHGTSGCAAEDEAAMGGCDCTATVDRCDDDDLPRTEATWYLCWDLPTATAVVQHLRDEVAGADENVASWQDIAADLRADRDELAAGYYTLLSQCHRLEEERNRLRDEWTVMLEALEAARALADLDTASWEDRQGALQEFDERIARVYNVIGDGR